MLKEYQVTLFSTTGKYRPESCIIKKDPKEMLYGKKEFIKDLKKKGVQKVCARHYWSAADLKAYGYTQIKVREYDKEKIQKENEERYEKIKEEKYTSGEWVRPKNK